MLVTRFTTLEEYQQAAETFANQELHPFVLPWYQHVFAQHFCNQEDIYLLGIYENEDLLSAGAFERIGDKILFLGMKPVLGKEEVTDYGDLLYQSQDQILKMKEIWLAIIDFFQKQQAKEMQLDYVREDSNSYFVLQDLQNTNSQLQVKFQKQEVAPYIQLPSTWDEYLMGMERKYRKELRRKIRRLETEQAFHFCQSETFEQDFKDFIRLHRLSDPAKNQFMTPAMVRFFWDLTQAVQLPWSVHFCFLTLANKRVASVMTFQTQDQVLFYNSGYDPAYQFYAVGFVLKAYMIKEAIESGKKVADWLRGNERYKYDLGSQDKALYGFCLSLA